MQSREIVPETEKSKDSNRNMFLKRQNCNNQIDQINHLKDVKIHAEVEVWRQCRRGKCKAIFLTNFRGYDRASKENESHIWKCNISSNHI